MQFERNKKHVQNCVQTLFGTCHLGERLGLHVVWNYIAVLKEAETNMEKIRLLVIKANIFSLQLIRLTS